MKNKDAAKRREARRETVWKVLASLDGCKVTAKQIISLLDITIGESAVCEWIRKFTAEGLLEKVERRTDKNGNYIKVKTSPGITPEPP